MKFLRLASSFLSNKNQGNEDKEGIIAKAKGFLTASLIPLLISAIPFIILGLVFVVLISILSYKFNVLQFVDSISGNESKKNSSAIVGGQGSLTSEQRQKIVDFAYSQIGVPYNYGPGGACGGGYAENDIPGEQLSCNGLTRWAYNAAGIDIPVGSREQISEAPVVTSTGNVSDMTAGDIIVFDEQGRRSDIPDIRIWSYRHVAIYVGDGELIEGTCPVAQKRSIGDNEYSYSVTW